jgi:TRAP-type C4-dicarboxylate transport system permease large subunit
MIGLVTPPVGALLFALCGMENIPMEHIIRRMWPFIGILLSLLVVISVWPALVLTLPNYLF